MMKGVKRFPYGIFVTAAVSGVLAWLLLFTGIWATTAIAGVVAGALLEIRYTPAFVSCFAGGAAAALVWLQPLFDPGAGVYVAAIGALASIPGYLLVALSFIFTAMFVACGGLVGAWARHLMEASRHASS